MKILDTIALILGSIATIICAFITVYAFCGVLNIWGDVDILTRIMCGCVCLLSGSAVYMIGSEVCQTVSRAIKSRKL